MSAFSLHPIFADYIAIHHGSVKAAIIYPVDETGRVAIYPNPEAYSGLNFRGLPAPLKPEFEFFDSLDAVAERLGIALDLEIAA